MRVLRVFFVGVLYGWFLRWIIDEIFVRDHLRRITNENTLLRERLVELEAPRSQAILPEPRTERAQPIQPMQPAVEPLRRGETPAPSTVTERTSQRDDLKLIKGIGPQLEKKLNNAGVTTFEQMARLTATELQAILGISKRVVQNTDNLLSQARKFAEDHT